MLGYKGFYKTKDINQVQGYFGDIFIEGNQYKLATDTKLEFGIANGNGFHFCKTVSQTMPYFYTALGCTNFKVGIIETTDEIFQNPYNSQEFVTKGFILKKILSHAELINWIKEVDISEAIKILDYYNKNMDLLEKQDIENYLWDAFNTLMASDHKDYSLLYEIYGGILTLQNLNGFDIPQDIENANEKWLEYIDLGELEDTKINYIDTLCKKRTTEHITE